ncbi:hypothetical protein CIHG_06490 [Coccidioides immitis H538.4]|uniref:Uncharacterized protein n=1 Tax=Coccidioides immitis H538.4 TaxID=396776 RepID=A0A0J8UMN7_COCIT|nr:hypothetical protein CIHG_06490 [Coccidioides immitis H538.4]
MATAHPEGEVFFRKSSLKLGTFNADDPRSFYGHFLIEFASNEYFARQHLELPPERTHPRSTYRRERASGVPDRQWRYGFWEELPVSLGQPASIRRRFNVPLETTVNRFRDRANGGAQHVWVHPCPMPTEQETWAWFDMLIPIRAIYLPLSQVAEESFPHLCTYVQIVFYQQGVRDVWRPNQGRFLSHTFTTTHGVGFALGFTLGINIHESMKLLGLPPKLRNTNIWREKLIVIRGRDEIRTQTRTPLPPPRFDFVDFINANFAVEVIWKPVPPRSSFLLNLIENLITAALGPGPCQWAANGGWLPDYLDAMRSSCRSMGKYIDPGVLGGVRAISRRGLLLPPATDGNHSNESQVVVPPAQTSTSTMEDSVESSNLADVGPSAVLLSGLRIIAFSATSGKTAHQDGELHSDILRRAVRCDAMSLEEAFAVQRGLEALPDGGDDSEDGEISKLLRSR